MEIKRIAPPIPQYKHLSTLYNNIFIFSPIFTDFYEKITISQNNILLSPLLLPLVLYPASRRPLTTANKTTTLRSFLKPKERIAGLNQRILEYQDITNLCLQYLIDQGTIHIYSTTNIEVLKKAPSILPNVTKPAHRLAFLFNEINDIVIIYRMLGVRKYEIND